jgi:hypothetical protein
MPIFYCVCSPCPSNLLAFPRCSTFSRSYLVISLTVAPLSVGAHAQSPVPGRGQLLVASALENHLYSTNVNAGIITSIDMQVTSRATFTSMSWRPLCPARQVSSPPWSCSIPWWPHPPHCVVAHPDRRVVHRQQQRLRPPRVEQHVRGHQRHHLHRRRQNDLRRGASPHCGPY